MFRTIRTRFATECSQAGRILLAGVHTTRERERLISLMTTALVMIAGAGTFGLSQLAA